MDVRTPALILLCSLVAALAFAVLGLAADNVSYAHKHGSDTLDIHYLRWNQTAEATYSYWVQIDYLPSRYSLTRINAMLGASIITAPAGIAVAAISWLVRGDRAPSVGINFKKQKHSVSLLPFGLVLAAIAFIISFAVAIYAWYPMMKWPINFKNSLPFPPSITGDQGKTVKYMAPFDFGPEWNCWISDYTVNPAMSRQMRNMCNEANVAKILMLPIVVLSAALTIGLGMSWWKASRSTASKTETNEKDVEEVSI